MSFKSNSSAELRDIALKMKKVKQKSPSDFQYIKGFVQALYLKENEKTQKH